MLKYALLLLGSTLAAALSAQWTPGDCYREYYWVMPEEGEAFLRVGGRYGYAAQPGNLPAYLQDGADLLLSDSLDLEGAVRAEVTIEKVMSHEDTRGLAIALNGHAPRTVGEPEEIPTPREEYMYHTELTVPLPLDELRGGRNNRFRLTVDTSQRWGWPQNLIYGLTFRIYYAAERGPVVAPPGGGVGETAYVGLGADAGAMSLEKVRSVDYILVGREADWSGRGTPHRKHWQTHRGQPHHTVGRSTDRSTGFTVRWNTAWLPDPGPEGIRLQARALGADGKYRAGPVSEALHLRPRPYSIQLYTAPAPRNWVTRSGTFEQTLLVTDTLAPLEALQLNWTSWSPCYSNGLLLNGHLIWSRTDDCYVYATHEPVYTGHELLFLQPGENVIATALTPLVRGGMVHGMEVQWPGVQLKTRRTRALVSD